MDHTAICQARRVGEFPRRVTQLNSALGVDEQVSLLGHSISISMHEYFLTKKKETSYNNQYKLLLATPQQTLPRVQYQHHSTTKVNPKTKPYHLDAQKLMPQVISNENIKHHLPSKSPRKGQTPTTITQKLFVALSVGYPPKASPQS
ncbi:hypothetical protein [Pseudomonas sp. NMI4491_12]|uniref:hypothetical protein n=1 Tax=Pseudomonas sp. NMI4491_12 TaxID=2903146 RepID=UPI001E3E7D12|nr:hypothetical protein [Pseudomonas sp. NMI4491_12]MCE0967185.1 hypothetical protein [Pseudomonas sp. NMI4491_12]